MKINKQLYYSIFICIIYFALFTGCSMDFSNQYEREYPITLAAFVILVLLYIRLFKDKQSVVFYIASMVALPIMLIFLLGMADKFLSSLNDWFLYICQYILFVISCILLLLTINRIFKKNALKDDDAFILIKGKKYLDISFVLLIFIGAIFLTIYLHTDLFDFNYSKKYNDNAIIPDTTAQVIAVGEETPNDYENYEESDEADNDEVINTYSLSSLWENPEDDENIIQDLIVFYMDNFLPLDGQGSLEHINKYNYIYKYFGITTEEENEEVLNSYENCNECKFNFSHAAAIKNKINRDSNLMKSVFYTYKHLLYESLSHKNYYKADINNYVDILILSYSDIYSNSNPGKLLMDIQQISELNNPEVYYEKISSIEKLVSEDYKKEYKNIYYGNGTKVRDEDLFWAYTFWARRNKENNAKEVYDILIEVQNHYGEN